MGAPSTAILCVALNEQPFAREWLDYHLRLGFERIYFVLTDSDASAALDYYTGLNFGDRVEFFHFSDCEHGWQNRLYSEFVDEIKEDWLLVLDLDEFLYLHEAPSIGDYLKGFPPHIRQVQFPWMNMFSLDYLHRDVLGAAATMPCYASNHVKSIAYRSQIRGVGVHYHPIGDAASCLSSGEEVQPESYHRVFVEQPDYYQHHAFVIHAASRGHLDTLCRIVAQRFHDPKCGELERKRLRSLLCGRARGANLPNRYLHGKIQQSFPRVEVTLRLAAGLPKTDLDELLAIFLRNIRSIVDFHCDHLSSVAPAFEERFMLNEKLKRLDIRGHVSIEEAVSELTQDDYARQLRRRLGW
ncbi:MAG: glycosyltransferase family 2 protein [Pseudomonadota bacterium]